MHSLNVEETLMTSLLSETLRFLDLNYINLPRYSIKPFLPPIVYLYINIKIMETINLTIPNMKSPHCQMTVTSAVKAIGANVKSVSPTKAEIELNAGLTKDAVIQAIQQAGYNVLNGSI
jgi:copper chaperone CopZ